MSRIHPSVLLALIFMLLILPACGAGAATPTYTYELADSKQKQTPVCAHMGDVFNRSFRRLWDADFLTSEEDQHFAADSRYAFPLLPGVEHHGRTTFDMRYSRVPSSPEFDDIRWKEGRAVTAAGASPQPILVAQFDFDNDGRVDTVIKLGFNRGYDSMIGGRAADEERLYVFSDQRLVLAEPVLLSAPYYGAPPGQDSPEILTSTYQRPFLFQGHTYVARYGQTWAEELDPKQTGPYKPTSENMTIVSFGSSGRSDETVCTFVLRQVSER